jgi:lipoate-protein ligase B
MGVKGGAGMDGPGSPAAPTTAPPSHARRPPLWVLHLGVQPYRRALALQEQLVAARLAGEVPDLLLLLQHPPVITCGRATRPGHVLVDTRELARRGVELVESTRGGDVTLHGPGQLVGYPILDLREHGSDVHRYLRGLEETLIRTLSRWSIRAERVPGLTGVWIGNDKIAAIGVAIKRWVTYHGFALNVDIDLSWFQLIVPCGLSGRGVTSMAARLAELPEHETVAKVAAAAFADVFQRALTPPVHQPALLDLP